MLVGNSKLLVKLRKEVVKVSQYNINTLILGETGTGKSLVAQEIHKLYNKKAPFVYVNCGGIVPSLLESELFGHVKGAFTDARTKKVGLIEKAEDGVLFLDEIGELPLEFQAKLLHFLETHEYRPVGATTVRKSKARIVSATNRDLLKDIDKKKFRTDLYYRLATYVIIVPPLRDHKEDIPPLARYFIKQIKKEHKDMPLRGIANAAVELLQDYDWPGNVRELRHVIIKAGVNALHEGKRVIQVRHLPKLKN